MHGLIHPSLIVNIHTIYCNVSRKFTQDDQTTS